jgi:hypothetical protein
MAFVAALAILGANMLSASLHGPGERTALHDPIRIAAVPPPDHDSGQWGWCISVSVCRTRPGKDDRIPRKVMEPVRSSRLV